MLSYILTLCMRQLSRSVTVPALVTEASQAAEALGALKLAELTSKCDGVRKRACSGFSSRRARFH